MILCNSCINNDECVSNWNLKEYCLTHDWDSYEAAIYYKGYLTIPKYSPEDDLIYGKIENISDLVSFHGRNIEQFILDFHKMVDMYLTFKAEVATSSQSEIEPHNPALDIHPTPLPVKKKE